MRILCGQVALVVLMAWALPTAAQPAWEVVTSKEGGFTVEMPTKPAIKKTRTRKGPDGTVKVMLIGCETDHGLYLAYRIDLPTAIVKGAEEAELSAARDDLAQDWNGKVISEKKVKVGLRIGDTDELSGLNEALKTHCLQSARIVHDFCGEWYSKTEFQRGIDLENTSGFMAVALRKLEAELRRQREGA